MTYLYRVVWDGPNGDRFSTETTPSQPEAQWWARNRCGVDGVRDVHVERAVKQEWERVDSSATDLTREHQ